MQIPKPFAASRKAGFARLCAIAMAQAGVWQKRQGIIRHATQGRDARFARGLVASAGRADRIVKGALKGQTWNALLELTMTLAGGKGWRAEIA